MYIIYLPYLMFKIKSIFNYSVDIDNFRCQGAIFSSHEICSFSAGWCPRNVSISDLSEVVRFCPRAIFKVKLETTFADLYSTFQAHE